MTEMTCEIVEHAGGWAYKVKGVFLGPFPSHDDARRAAERAAMDQGVSGETTSISYEDSSGHWHDEVLSGDDRPKASVKA